MGLGDPIRVLRCSNEDAEAERVATEILTQRLRLQRKFRDYAILYRGNHQARLLEMKLQQHQIPYKIRDRKSTRLNSSHVAISYAVFCLKKKIEIAIKSKQQAHL